MYLLFLKKYLEYYFVYFHIKKNKNVEFAIKKIKIFMKQFLLRSVEVKNTSAIHKPIKP